MSQLIVEITPQLPPHICGLGDYATLVGRKIADSSQSKCAFVAAGCKASAEPMNAANVRNITGACDSSRLWQAIDSLRNELDPSDAVSVVLNYSGYGYERNGCPEWLITALTQRPQWITRVVTFFHELFATGLPWQRAFWFSRRQQRIAANLCALTDVAITNRSESAKWLQSCRPFPGEGVRCLAVPSNIGELPVNTAYEHRGPTAVCFGARRFKERFFSASAGDVSEICRTAGIRQIVNIGENIATVSPRFSECQIEIVQTGYLEAGEVSRHMSNARVAFANYFPAGLAKSGVFAALAAHGVPTIAEDQCNLAADGLAPGEHYLCRQDAVQLAANGGLLPHALERLSQKLFAWYQTHNIAAHAELIAKAATG